MPTVHAAHHLVPKTLDAWVKLLDGIALPVPAVNHGHVRAALNDSRRSLREIAEMMQESPALVLSVMREANHHTHGLTEQAESLEIAINRLGLARTEVLLGRLPAKPPEEIPAAYRQLILVSQHATQQANGLFASRLARLWQDIHMGSLLFLSPLWPMALAYPKLLEELELRVIHKGHSSAAVEKELFGVNLLELCLALAEFWRLPIWVTRGYKLLINERRDLAKALRIAREDNSPLQQQQLMDDDPNLRRWLNQPANTVLLGNGLALAAQQAWNSPHCLRWERLTSLYLQQSMSEVQQQAHQNAASSARIHAEKDLWHPAESLIWPWDARRVRRDNEPAPPPSADALQLWRKQCAKRRADVEPADGHRALFGRKPFGGRLDACRQPCCFGQTEHAAEDRQTLPTGCKCGGSAGARPGDGENRKAHLGADRVDDIARHGLHDGVAQLPGDNDVRVLLGGNAQFAHERRCCDGQRVACQVVDDQAGRYQPHHPPPNAFYLHLFTPFIFRLAMSVPRPRP